MSRRGQTLVLFALSLLLLALMVLMTLSIGMKAKEKMELQTVADAAAYSNAVATARTFNSVSLMNRALMGHMVAMSGVESLISWSSYYRASIHGARKAYNNEPKKTYEAIRIASCPCAPFNGMCAKLCKCSNKALQDISKARDKLAQADQKIEKQWKSLDGKAGDEAKGLQISSISDEQKKLFQELLDRMDKPKKEYLAKALVDEANEAGHFGEEIQVADSADEVNKRELNGGEGCASEGAACTRRRADKKLHFVYATMGSRGYSFVTKRGEGSLIQMKLQTLMPQGDLVTNVSNDGSGYFPAEGQKTHSGQSIDATEVWADDHGEVDILFTRGQMPCPPILPGNSGRIDAHVRSTHLADNSDAHVWEGGQDNGTEKKKHTMGKCTQCPGMWPSHMDYNFKRVDDASGDDNWGQPKNYAVIQRDYKKRMEGSNKDPWNLRFDFRFGPRETTFDNRGVELTSDGTDIHMATALSTGITYYKRAGDFWQEPPNFLNPFWRATLVSAHVDKKGKDEDVESVLGDSAAFTRDAYRALKQRGYEAW